MVRSRSIRRTAVFGLVALALTLMPLPAAADGTDTFVVEITNTTSGQPFSPPVVATHSTDADVFEVGETSSDGVAAIAQGGNPVPLFDALGGLDPVTEAVNVGRPLAPGTAKAGFASSVVFTIDGRPGDVLSVVTMLICTNDGFAGLDSVELPDHGTVSYDLGDYDAGREENTEVSEDLVDPCSGLGPVMLPGDPDGNIDDADGVATVPNEPIAAHPNIAGVGELTEADHGWASPVGSVTIAKLVDAFDDDDGNTHEDAINALTAVDVIEGFTDGTFGPLENVTRGQMASLLVRALDLPASDTDAFADDNGTTHEDAIDALAAAGITEGTGPDTYDPDGYVTRGQMASFLTRAFDVPPSDVDAFADDDGTTHEDAIDALAAAGITQGTGPDTYEPGANVTRGQIASFLLRALGPAT